MSYTPEDERFDDIEYDLMDAIKRFCEVASNRIRSDVWNKEHKEKLLEARQRIQELELLLLEVF